MLKEILSTNQVLLNRLFFIEKNPHCMRLILIILTAAISTTAYREWGHWLVSIIAYSAFFLILISKEKLRLRVIYCLSFVVTCNIFNFYWMFDGTQYYPIDTQIILNILLSSILLFSALPFLLITTPWILFKWIGFYSRSLLIIVFPIIFTLIEKLQEFISFGIIWSEKGNLLVDTSYSSVLPITGVLGLSYIHYLLSGILALTLFTPSKLKLLNVALILLVMLTIAHLPKTPPFWTFPAENTEIKALLLHGDNSFDKAGTEADNSINRLSLYSEITLKNRSFDLALWPETTISFPDKEASPFIQALLDSSRAYTREIWFGGYTIEGQKQFNSLISSTSNRAIYKKHQLIPIMEQSLDLSEFIRPLFSVIPRSKLTPGELFHDPIAINNTSVSPSICYEILRREYIAINAREAGFMLNVSNLSVFNSKPFQSHMFRVARIRAMENQKPMVISSNRGISGHIDHLGTIITKIDKPTVSYKKVTIVPRKGSTPYSERGDINIIVSLLTALLVYIPWIVVIQRRRNRNPNET